ncbi:Vacuolar protein sorting-associated protein 36 [Hibiscus syriacus]|uniref:Vacuolar protein-sorting-associated protein 36 n=1 Tax=Hibiscus syriacus TaxID=106335 RepID=A0A6A2XPZ8_HIBSY|nr:Vacuolar protein sorting-associated protein 36 [Hibiscus syriacus]
MEQFKQLYSLRMLQKNLWTRPQPLPPLKSGILIVTTHRLLWLPSSATPPTTVSAVPLAAISHIFSSKKYLKSVFHSPRIRFRVLVSPDGRVFEPGSGSGASIGTVGGLYSSDGSVRMVGVAGILRKEQEMWKSTDKSLQDAFQDLNALMSKAKDMVMPAEKKMRQKLLSGTSSQTSGTNGEDMGSKEEMQDWLLSVGIISPFTKESVGIEAEKSSTRKFRIPGFAHPSPVLSTTVTSVMLRKFDSGVMVIQNKSHSDDEIFARIKSLATKTEVLRNGVSPTDAAMTSGIAPAMAKEHLLTAESKGLLCRDISLDGFRFYINLFPEIDPCNIYLIMGSALLGSRQFLLLESMSAFRRLPVTPLRQMHLALDFQNHAVIPLSSARL